MKNKILLSLLISIFLIVTLGFLKNFSNVTFAANGQNCASAGGSCRGGCGSGEQGLGQQDCDSIEQCCRANSGGSSSAPQGGGGGGSQTTSFPNPVNAKDLPTVLNNLLSNLMQVVAIIAIIFIVIGGVMYMTSAGDEKRITAAKNTWTYAVIGLAIVLAAPTFLREIIEILGGSSGLLANGQISGALRMRDIAERVLTFLLSIVGILAIIALVIGGGMYLTSYGDEDRMTTGKKTATWALIGIAVALGSLVLVRQIASFFGVQ